MTRRLSAAALSAVMLVALAASCSKTETTTTTASSSPSTTAAASTTEAPSDEPTETTTKKSSSTSKKSSSSTMPTKDVELTDEEETCAGLIYADYLSDNPGASEANKAGALGRSIVECTTKAKVADTILSGLKSSKLGSKISSGEESCMREKIISLDTVELATLLGYFIYAGNTDNIDPAVEAVTDLAKACGVST
jgi:hypothetical protein